MVRVRLATVADAAGVLGVYAPYVEETPITFETSVPSEETFAARMRAVIGDYPYLVVEDAGRIVGFAYARRLGERDAYEWNVELSVYFAPTHTGRGWGERSVLGADRFAGPAGGAKRLQLGDRSQ